MPRNRELDHPRTHIDVAAVKSFNVCFWMNSTVLSSKVEGMCVSYQILIKCKAHDS